MAPEYGQPWAFVDEVTLEFLRQTGRTEEEVALVENYTKAQGLFRTDDGPELQYTKTVSLDLGSVEPVWLDRKDLRIVSLWQG